MKEQYQQSSEQCRFKTALFFSAHKTSGVHRPPLARYLYTISCITTSFARFRMPFIFRTHDCGSLAFNLSVTPSASAYCSTSRRKSSCACSSMSARCPPSVPAVSRLYNTAPGDVPSDRLAAAARKCRWDVLLRAVSKLLAGSSRPALCKCRPAAQIAIPYVILPLKISTAGLQCKMHPPFGYSLPKPKGRCECANFRIARSVRYCDRL